MAGRKARTLGQHAEKAAQKFLAARGLTLIERNFNTRHGEIDLVMLDSDTIVFVEVRSRGRTSFSCAVASVDAKKRRKLIAAASLWLARNPGYAHRPCRFDVLGYADASRPVWCRDAFRG